MNILPAETDVSTADVTYSCSSPDSAMSNLLLSMLGAVAEFERSLIRERQAEGIALARARGVYKGRRRALNADQVEETRSRVAAGVPKSVVARELGVSRQTVYNALTERAVA